MSSLLADASPEKRLLGLQLVSAQHKKWRMKFKNKGEARHEKATEPVFLLQLLLLLTNCTAMLTSASKFAIDRGSSQNTRTYALY